MLGGIKERQAHLRMQSLTLTSQLTSVSPCEVVCPLIDARGNVFRSARDIRAPEVAKVTKLNPSSDIPDLQNSVISFSAFQSELDEWHYQEIIFLLGCNKSYGKCSEFHTPMWHKKTHHRYSPPLSLSSTVTRL